MIADDDDERRVRRGTIRSVLKWCKGKICCYSTWMGLKELLSPNEDTRQFWIYQHLNIHEFEFKLLKFRNISHVCETFLSCDGVGGQTQPLHVRQVLIWLFLHACRLLCGAMAAHLTSNQKVAGSSPASGKRSKIHFSLLRQFDCQAYLLFVFAFCIQSVTMIAAATYCRRLSS